MKRDNSGYIRKNRKFLNKIKSILSSNDVQKLQGFTSSLTTKEIAFFLNYAENEQRSRFIFLTFTTMPPEILLMLDNKVIVIAMNIIGSKEFANMANKLNSDDLLDLFRIIDKKTKTIILPLINKEKRDDLQELISYHEDNIGKIINKEIVMVPSELSIKEAILKIKKDKNFSKNTRTVFIVDDSNSLLGQVSVNKLLHADKQEKILTIMEINKITISSDASKEDVISLFRNEKAITIAPVVNNHHMIVGEISLDSVLSLLVCEVEDDLQKLSQSPMLESGDTIGGRVFARFPWLLANTALASIISLMIGLFSETINSTVSLAVLIPIITSMGGCCSAQIAVSAVRSIATKELEWSNFTSSFYKEIKTTVSLAIIMSILSGAISFIRYQSIIITLLYISTIQLTFLLAAISGMFTPMIINGMGKDPAIASPVVVNAMTDAFSYIFFLGMASIFI